MNKREHKCTPIKEAHAGLKVFFSAVSEWKLSVNEAKALLGNPSRHRYNEYKSGKVHSVSDDFLFRLAYLTTIEDYDKLRLTYFEDILAGIYETWRRFKPTSLNDKLIKSFIFEDIDEAMRIKTIIRKQKAANIRVVKCAIMRNFHPFILIDSAK